MTPRNGFDGGIGLAGVIDKHNPRNDLLAVYSWLPAAATDVRRPASCGESLIARRLISVSPIGRIEDASMALEVLYGEKTRLPLAARTGRKEADESKR